MYEFCILVAWYYVVAILMALLQKLEELHTAVEGSGAHSVVVQGPSGCGKTSLLREYFSLCGRTVGDSVIVVHLGEQIDSKVSSTQSFVDDALYKVQIVSLCCLQCSL